MKLIEFLIQVIQTHSQILNELRNILGEENLLKLLKTHHDRSSKTSITFILHTWVTPPISPSSYSSSSPFSKLEAAVQRLQLPPRMEFYIWSYPFYRLMIESPMDLNSLVTLSKERSPLVEEALVQAKDWLKQLSFPPETLSQMKPISQALWLRFRTQVLTQLGKRPLGVIS